MDDEGAQVYGVLRSSKLVLVLGLSGYHNLSIIIYLDLAMQVLLGNFSNRVSHHAPCGTAGFEGCRWLRVLSKESL